MSTSKRQGDEGSPGGGNRVKRPKLKKNDGPAPALHDSHASMLQGPDDSSVLALFNALFYATSTFVGQFFQGLPYVKPRKNDHMTFFNSLVGTDCVGYLKSKDSDAKAAIILAAIWNKLTGKLLSTPTRAFIDTMPETTVRKGTSSWQDFCAWRAHTADLLANNYEGQASWGPGGSGRQGFLDDMVQHLSDHSAVRGEKLQRGLDDIADHAFQLASAMARSRARWVCTMKDPDVGKLHGFQIKAGSMDDIELWAEDEGHARSTIVDLVKTPMLLKYGNSDGQNYDQRVVFKKAGVVVKPKKPTK